MRECICSSCKNLIGMIGSEGNVEEYNCIYGFPSEKCVDCEAGECEENCSNYISDETEDELRTVHCEHCGKELKASAGEDDSGIYCIGCYLNGKG